MCKAGLVWPAQRSAMLTIVAVKTQPIWMISRALIYDKEILEAEEVHRRVLLDWAASHGNNAAYIHRCHSSGIPSRPYPWEEKNHQRPATEGEADHVHLVPDAY